MQLVVSFPLGSDQGETRQPGAEQLGGRRPWVCQCALAAALVREKGGRARGPREARCVSSPSGVAKQHFKDVRCSSFS